jgi:hypothetical protein
LNAKRIFYNFNFKSLNDIYIQNLSSSLSSFSFLRYIYIYIYIYIYVHAHTHTHIHFIDRNTFVKKYIFISIHMMNIYNNTLNCINCTFYVLQPIF